MIQIYHNPRCSKSREALQYLQDKQLPHEVVNYMDEPLTFEELEEVLDKLGMDPFELIRLNEQIWKDEFAEKDMDDNELIFLMVEYPQLMQRPIVVNGEMAVLARPASKIDELL
jgi:arsenate reductase